MNAVKTGNPECTCTQTTHRFDSAKDCDNGNSLHQNDARHYPLSWGIFNVCSILRAGSTPLFR
jgi:hypothetical protein